MFPSSLTSHYQRIFGSFQSWLEPLVLLGARFLVARVFFISGLAKWDGFLTFNVDSYDLFLYEFFCPDPVRPGALLLCNPETLEYEDGSFTVSLIEAFAVTAGVMEVILPLLLVIGLFTRFAALGLLAMVAFIQLAVFPEIAHWWNPAAWWAAVLLVIVAIGPGRFALDKFFRLEK